MPVPVALFTYKRPDHTKATLEALARNTLAADTKLFVFSDGPKTELESAAVHSVRDVVRKASGFASVNLIERHENMGLANSIISGVTELFEETDAIIVLEDDLVTSKNFLTYMNNSLAYYREDPFAFSVTGHTYPERFLRIPGDYRYDTYASYRCASWSWGTWRDRWQRVNWGMSYFPYFSTDSNAQREFNRGGPEMTELLRMQYDGKIDSWAIRFCYAHFANKMHCIYPTKTLVRNIGLDGSGAHCVPDPRFTHTKIDESWLPHNFCPADEVNPKICRRFRAVFGKPRTRNDIRGALSALMPGKKIVSRAWSTASKMYRRIMS